MFLNKEDLIGSYYLSPRSSDIFPRVICSMLMMQPIQAPAGHQSQDCAKLRIEHLKVQIDSHEQFFMISPYYLKTS